MSDLIRDLSKPLEITPTGTEARLPILKGIQHLVFDVYGTLLISGAGAPPSLHEREKTLRQFISEYNSDTLPDFFLSVYFENLIAKSHTESRKAGVDYPEVNIRDIWVEFFTSLGLVGPLNLDDFILRYELATNPSWPMPGAQDIMSHPLAAGIVSNAQFYTPQIMEAFQLPKLEHTLFSYNYGEAKPGTFLFKKLAQKVNPAETLYLGNDRLKDIAPAALCGFKTALFAGDQRSLRLHSHRKDLPEPDAIVTSLSQIPKILGG